MTDKELSSGIELEHAEDMQPVDLAKPPQRAYVADTSVRSHNKTTAERSLVLKSDLSIIPLASLIYFAAYLDRNNLGNARLLGLQESLQMSNQQYDNCLMMFYIGYIIFMIPANIFLRAIGPHRQLGAAVIAFGVMICCLSAAKNSGAVLGIRILVGCFQAFIQGLGVYQSFWYKRDEIATRAAAYYSAATISGAFSGLIAYAVDKNLTGVGGKAGWQWLFIIEGSMAIAIGLATWLLLPPFPDQVKEDKHWLFSEADIRLAKMRAASYNTLDAKIDLKQIFAALKDPKTYFFAFMNGGVALGIASVSVFLPTFIQAFGYSNEKSQLFSVIPYACATLCMLGLVILSDRLNVKGVMLVFCISISCVGYIILIIVSSIPVKIFATCLVVSGLYPSVVLGATWLGINTGGFTKRGTVWAITEIFGQCFSIIGTHIYTDPPRYIKGHSVLLGFLVFSILNVVMAYFWMKRLNLQKEKIIRGYFDRGEPHPDTTKSLEEVHDYHIAFHYTL